jgi:rhamnose utilization protein RhaD (predicted bifunctional aldolase and dehydrogenase)/NAD(P)-dependent dehydrogenase (short-subunit alcohol dehydrogenase family)
MGIMKTLYHDQEAREFIIRYSTIHPSLALRIYTSRLLGKDPHLVLHGGGNTSVKLMIKNIFGEEREVLYIKGSGKDLAAIEPSGFVGLELAPLKKLQRLSNLSEGEMENQLLIHKIAFSSPDPSVEALLHAFLPARYIDHTHADSVLILSHQKKAENFLREALGEKTAVIPYLTPGMALAQGVRECYERNPGIEAIAVIHHGIFTFGLDAKTSYERMIQYVGRAEKFIHSKTRKKIFGTPKAVLAPPQNLLSAIARFSQTVRGACSFRRNDGRRRRFYIEFRHSPDLIKGSLTREARELCNSGVLTPDHVIRTKNLWAYVESIQKDDQVLQQKVKEVIRSYQAAYEQYFKLQVKAKKREREKLDSYPRVFLVAGVGIFALGFTRNAARIAADIAEHSLKAKIQAKAVGGYIPIAESHVFDMEYWPLQQKKLGPPSSLPLEGQIACITGGGGAVGLGIADRLLAAGAVVVISDIDAKSLQTVYSVLTRKYDESLVEKILLDVTDYESVSKALQQISCRLGGMDILVPNAGMAHVAKVEDLDPKKLEQVTAVNLKGTFNVIKASIPIFKRQGTGGNIVVVSSKNVFDPGAAFGAYSASKAGAHQISKIAALELAEWGVRVNLINPDAIFGDEEVPSKLWELVGPERMKSRGLDPQGLRDYYRQRNLLKVQVTAEHVGNAVVFFAAEGTPTTGATLPVDGGIPAAFPR